MFGDFATGHDLVFGNGSAEWPGWQLEQSLLAPGAQGQDAQAFIGHLMDDLGAKRVGANFTVTFCDMWGRAVSSITFSPNIWEVDLGWPRSSLTTSCLGLPVTLLYRTLP